MRFVICGLSVSSSWGNGHATLWRGLLKALSERGHTAVFFEKDVPYYANARDGWQPPANVELRLYKDLRELRANAQGEFAQADVALVTSFCPDGAAVSRLVLDSNADIKAFYDLDTPVTLDAAQSGREVPYLPVEGLSSFDLVLSYTGGRALSDLRSRFGASNVYPLYGWADPESHRPVLPTEELRCELSYLGTYAKDRQMALGELFIKPASQLTSKRFLLAGAQYPDDFPWSQNIHFLRHLAPEQHSAFFCSGRATLNVTRQAMASYGFCPSGRLFEAAACGAPIITDTWQGLETFFEPGVEILPATTHEDVLAALSLTDQELSNVAEAARIRTLEQHTAACRAAELERILQQVYSGQNHTLALV